NEKVNRKDSQINTIQKNQQKIFEEHPFSMMIYSLDSLKILNVNNTAVETYGYSKSEFYNLTVKDFHDSEDKKMLVNHISAIKSGKSITKDWRHLKKNK
ncbi:MAG: PAS domain-containing protein, partial [Flavobacteriales bacterium]